MKNAAQAVAVVVERQSEFAEYVNAQLKERELTITKLARSVGSSRNYLSEVLSGSKVAPDVMAIRVAKAIGVPVSETTQRALRDRVARDAPELLESVASPTIGPHFEAAHAHLSAQFDYRIGRSIASMEVDATGTARFKRMFEDCVPAPGRAVQFIDFDGFQVDGVTTPTFPRVTVMARPGLEHESCSLVSGSRAIHRITFSSEPWSAANDTGRLCVRFEGEISGAYKTTPPPNRRPSWYSGVYRYRTRHPTERLELSIRLGEGLVLPAKWLDPWAWPGRDPADRVPRNCGASGSCASMRLETEPSAARLFVERPLPGFTFAILWQMPDDVAREAASQR